MFHVLARRSRSRLSRGLTLIELVVVIIILAVLAGLVIPNLVDTQLRANRSQAGSNMADMFRGIEQHRVTHNVYPDHWDSLLNETADGLSETLDAELWGDPAVPGSPAKLKYVEFPTDSDPAVNSDPEDKMLRSLSRMGLLNVHDEGGAAGAIGFAGDVFWNTARGLTYEGGYATLNISYLGAGMGIDTANSDEDAVDILSHILHTPAADIVEDGTHYLVVGVGQGSDFAKNNLEETPFYANNDRSKYYCRYLAIFAFYEGGDRAKLVSLLGADGDHSFGELVDVLE
ncbi:MAG: type IV pilin protein [Planctomycetota bacterium]